MDNQNQGYELGLSMVIMLTLIFLVPVVTVFASDYYQIQNAKEQVDNVIKQSILNAMQSQIDDSDLSNRVVRFDDTRLKDSIKQDVENTLHRKYGIAYTLRELDIKKDDKYRFRFNGDFEYNPMFAHFKLFPESYQVDTFTIKSGGRTKVQRFDWEDRADGENIVRTHV